jgi:magnesium chelatase subunit I
MVPQHRVAVLARFTRAVRESASVDARSGVSARFPIAAAETLAAAALRRATITGESTAVARACDLAAVVPSLLGKVEFEVNEEGREREVLELLLRRAVAETFRSRLGGVDLSSLVARFDEGAMVETGDLVTAAALLESLGPVPGLARLTVALEGEAGESAGVVAACLETALEGLFLTRRIGKDEVPGGTRAIYGGG